MKRLMNFPGTNLAVPNQVEYSRTCSVTYTKWNRLPVIEKYMKGEVCDTVG